MPRLLLIYPMSLSAEFLNFLYQNTKGCKNDIMGLIPSPASCTPVEKVLYTNGSNNLRKKAFKMNAKIKDVGLNEDLKSTETTKFS